MSKILKIERAGGTITRVRLRIRGVEGFTLTFTDHDVAIKWVQENEDKFRKDPGSYFKWLALFKKAAREKGEYTYFMNRREIIQDHILCTRGNKV